MRSIPKDPPYRNQKLRDLAKECPHCMNPWCGKINDGDIVLAHSNHLADGKGTGVKAHDIPCYLCRVCHDYVDGRLKPNGIVDPDAIRLKAGYYSTLWLLKEGHLVTK